MKDKIVRIKLHGARFLQHPKEDRSPRASIYTYTFQYGVIVITILLLAACSTSKPLQTQAPVILATDIIVPTQINTTVPFPSSTPKLKPQLPFDRIILIEVSTEIWAISYPFQSAVPLYQEENIIFFWCYCMVA